MNVASADDFTGVSTNRVAGAAGGALSFSSDVEGQRAVAEVQAAMVIAKRFPRDTVAAIEKIKNACARPRLAEQSMYSFSRGGSDITGPSIRLAEAVAQQWGNVHFSIVERESNSKESLVEAFCWDLETNVRVSKVFTVPHVRHTKQGSRPLTDPRDIYENVANNAARRLRACILEVIPGDVIEEAVAFCQQTLETKCDVGPDAQKKLLGAFRELGVTREQIETRIQRKVESILPAQMVQLRKIFASIRDGMSAVSDWFEAKPAGDGSGSGSGNPTADALLNAKGSTPAERPGKKTETPSRSNRRPDTQVADWDTSPSCRCSIGGCLFGVGRPVSECGILFERRSHVVKSRSGECRSGEALRVRGA
jgi:hypothetical protein